MKDKLMELAEQWKKEPLLGVYRMAVHACADDLIYHLDAEAQDHSGCQYSTGICGSVTAGRGKLDTNGYFEFPCDYCARIANLEEDLRALEEYAMAGVTLGTDDSKRLHATVDRIAPIAERKVPEWQPIDTAPKGNAILIYYANEVGIGRIVKAIYVERFTEEADPESEDPEYNESDDTHYTRAGWYELIDNWGDYSSVAIHHNPSHWMPLPAAPKVAP